MDERIREITAEVMESKEWVSKMEKEFSKVVVGQKDLLYQMLSAVFSGGHILLEGVPGLAKTLSIKTLSQILSLDFQRIQFTPDMLPADVRGTLIYNQGTGNFEIKKGPVFTNFVLADEINRAPAKVQSALLEVMQEKTVTLGDKTYILPNPFFVMATQNPIEQEGTYPLPEAQMDRFYMKVIAHYPSKKDEKEMIYNMTQSLIPEASPVLGAREILGIQNLIKKIYFSENITDYVVNLVNATRHPEQYSISDNYIKLGASPRASLSFIQAARVEAYFDGRGYVVPEDIKAVARPILRHRVQLSFEAEAEGYTVEDLLQEILGKVEIP